MIRRILAVSVVLGALAISAVANSEAASVKDIILAEVDPGGVNGTVVLFYDELTPEQEAEYSSSFENGDGYFISAQSTVTWIDAGVRYTQIKSIFVVPLGDGDVVVPLGVTCSHSGCNSLCTTSGCNRTKDSVGKPACSGAKCEDSSGSPCAGQNPTCSKLESTDTSFFLAFGSV